MVRRIPIAGTRVNMNKDVSIETMRIELQDWKAVISINENGDEILTLSTDEYDGDFKKLRHEQLRISVFRIKPLAEIIRVLIDAYCEDKS